jgi:nucleotide-binding universal stress UspA family protein
MSERIYNRLLLATQHTEFDVGAEALILEMAKDSGMPLAVVVPIASNPEYEAAAPELADRADREAAARVEAFRKLAAGKNVELDVTVRHGAEPYREIVEEAARRQSDLVVLRRRGKHSFLSNLLIGEMVTRVAEHAHCDILFVPRAATLWSRGILAAVDSSPLGRHVVEVAARVARQYGLPLHVVTVAHESGRAVAEETLARVLAYARGAGVETPHGHVLAGRPHEEIVQAAKKLNADLLVVGRHGENSLVRTALGGTTRKVIGLAEMPVLVAKAA